MYSRLNNRTMMRALELPRWSIVRTTRPQNLAEHSWHVAMLAQEIATLAGENPYTCAMLAINHDMPEVMTGDLVSPVKHGLLSKESVAELKEFEKFVHHCPGPAINVGDIEHVVVKCADLLSDAMYLSLYGADAHAEKVKDQLVFQLYKEIEPEHFDHIRLHTLRIWRTFTEQQPQSMEDMLRSFRRTQDGEEET